MPPPIECEIRAMLNNEQFDELLAQFKVSFEYLGSDEQETHYFDATEDVRIQKNAHYAKVWLKKGELHDEHREEIELKIPKEDFIKLEQLFDALGYKVAVKWFRTRHSFKWEDIDVTLDYSRGYGYIIELEKLADESGVEATVALLKEKLASLGIAQTPKEQFADKYKYYKENWKELTAIRK